ncbi:serine O-acetyltransferase [Sphingobacterium sp. HJSM2_6]|uniref:serine O-acetyltransferase n=1 Tax=Sphingobacterium sp. HJSM2_6 TaxID=3366264 RepID=UPI003BD7DA74
MNIRNRYFFQDQRMDYFKSFSKAWCLDYLLLSEQYFLRRYLSALRAEEYYTFESPNKLMRLFYLRRKNLLGRKLGFFISAGCFEEDLKVYHYGSIIVHPKAKIGKHCTIHGNCCIGTKGGNSEGYPVIGDHVDIGQGAQILGGITIANNVRIGAGAIVTKSILEEGVTVVGIPARILQ